MTTSIPHPLTLASAIPDPDTVSTQLARNLAERRLLRRQMRLALDREREALRLSKRQQEGTAHAH